MNHQLKLGELRQAGHEINIIGPDNKQAMLPEGDVFIIIEDKQTFWIRALTRFGLAELHTIEVTIFSRAL